MLLKKIKLENIRSYLTEEIIFPEGSVLLSGNIGSGKSSILLAIDFVLFGLNPGMGSALLRNGQDKGSVELHFNIDSKDIIIKRNLKRTQTGVTQDYGYLIINNEKTEGTATELKARIIAILNYPKELLTKSKSLIYRYTVYTPQEEMKTILLGDKDSRLETLRKVFGIDKYKRIMQNAEIFIKNLKAKNREFEIRIENLDRKNTEKQEKEKELERINIDIKKVTMDYENISFLLRKKKEELTGIEDLIKEKNRTKNGLELEQNNIKNYYLRIERENREINILQNEINSLEKELNSKKEENIDELIKKRAEIYEEISSKENEIRKLRDKVAELNSKKDTSESLREKITELNNCPTCLQEVKQEHKHTIIIKEEKNINIILENMNETAKKIKDKEEEVKKLKDKHEKINTEINEYNIISLKFKNLKEKEEKLKKVDREISELNSKINETHALIKELDEKIKKFQNIEEKCLLFRREIDELIKQDKMIGIRKATLEQNELDFTKTIEILKKEILLMEKIKGNLDYFKKLQKWLTDNFINMMQIMEKKIMLKAHSDFNSLFEKWFAMLVDNGMINTKLDEEFTPIITINSYETDYSHLSGGERTAAALAYRLALNQVINNLMSEIKTRDLIILDEPTDGFSSEQLDKVKLVLDELNLRQIIIVSHEPKIESFVDSVLRFDKKEHVSRIIS